MPHAYICLLRNDLDHNNLQVLDLKPNTSQRNPSLTVTGQTGYLSHSIGFEDSTVVSGDSYVSGSLFTYPLCDTGSNLVSVAAPDDAHATPTADFGLEAYLRERVQRAGAGGRIMWRGDIHTVVGQILSRFTQGLSLTLTDINTILNGVVAGTALTSAGGSDSFGSVEDVLRILAGEKYTTPSNTVITNGSGVFGSLAARTGLIATATDPSLWHAEGHFLTSAENGFSDVRAYAMSGPLNISCLTGALSKLKSPAFSWKNPSFTYGPSGNAGDFYGNHIGVNGVSAAVVVYDSNGNVL